MSRPLRQRIARARSQSRTTSHPHRRRSRSIGLLFTGRRPTRRFCNNSASSAVAQTVSKSTSTLALVVSPSSVVAGQTATGAAIISTAATTNAAGTVTYTVYYNNTCTTPSVLPGNPSSKTVTNRVVPNSDPIAINPVGAVYWKAVYGGDANNNGSSSTCVAQTVSKATPTITLTIAPAAIRVDETASASATLGSTTNAAVGMVTYTVYTDSICTTQISQRR